MKKISVIIPCYNVADYIDRCLTAVTGQTIGMENLEVICVDDASIDGTWEHLKRWEQLFPDHILLIRQNVNNRQGAARNLGLQHASSAWIAFLDADDWIEPDYFECLCRPAEQYGCDVVSCGFIRDAADFKECPDCHTRERGKEQHIIADTIETRKMLLRYKLLGPGAWAKLIRKDLLIENGIFFPEGVVYEDHYWIPLLHVCAENVYIIQAELYHYFWNPQATVLSRNNMQHLDQLTVQLMKWQDYDRRGLLEGYHKELEYDLLWYAVTSFMKTLLLFWDEPPFSCFRLGQEIIRQQIPDYGKNPYIEELSGVNRLLLEVLYSPVDQDGFRQIARQLKNVLVNG